MRFKPNLWFWVPFALLVVGALLVSAYGDPIFAVFVWFLVVLVLLLKLAVWMVGIEKRGKRPAQASHVAHMVTHSHMLNDPKRE